ncbi:hypothetical protein ACM66B_002422 [Microbotryomycetes sp. NB124-2]
MSRIEQVSVTLPATSQHGHKLLLVAYKLATVVPWWLWLALLMTAYYKAHKWWNKPLPGQLRRRTGRAHPTSSSSQRPSPAATRGPRLQASTKTASPGPPQLTHRTSQVWGPRQESQTSRHRSGSSVSSTRAGSPAPALYSIGHVQSQSPYQSSPRPGSHLRHQTSRSSLQLSDSAKTTRYQSPSAPAIRSKLKREFVPSPLSDDESTKRQRASYFGHDEDDDRPMELDELQAQTEMNAQLQAKRGRKRGRVVTQDNMAEKEGEDVGNKRRRNYEREEKESMVRPHRKHSRGTEEDDVSTAEGDDVSTKRRRRSERPLDKRLYRDISDDDGQFDYDEDFQDYEPPRHRNADSDVDDDGETRESNDGEQQRHKRTRSVSVRSASEEESVMGDDLPLESERTDAVSIKPTPKKRTLKSSAHKPLKPFSKSKRGPAPAVKHSPGDEWVNMEGDRCRMDEDGQVRKLCEVREMRRKHKMPADSVHPDAQVMHEVVVEKWLTDAEQDELIKQRKLAWQTPFEEVVDESATMAVDSPAEKKEKPSGFYYLSGTGTPLRSHSALAHRQVSSSRPNSRQGSPAGARSGSNSPALVNGRMRLVSGTQSPAGRSWSSSRIARLAEDEQKARAERDKRRKASIMLGGEQEPTAVEPELRKSKATETDTSTNQDKLKIGGLGADGKKLDGSPTITPSTTTPAAEAVKTGEPSKSPSGVPNFFSGLDKKDAPVKPEVSTAAATPSFSFNKPTDSKEQARPAAAAKPEQKSFSFGSTSISSAPVDKPSFSFGASTAPPTKDESSKPFSFGPAPSPPAKEATPALFAAAKPDEKPAAPSLSFGAPTKTDAPKSATAPSFSFGSTTPSVSNPTLSTGGPAPSFSFGAPTPAAQAAPNAKPSFSFGTSAAATPAAAAPASSVPSFSFGSATAPKPATPAAAAPSFSFGSSAPPPAAPANAGASSGFSFGSTASGNSTPAPSFSFGAPSAAPAQAAAGGFTFGAPSSATAGAPVAPAMFSLGSSGGGNESDSSAAGGNRRRPVRRMPSRAPMH